MKLLSSWDDGGVHDVRIAELMTKYGIETTFYVPVMWQKVNTLKQRYSISLGQLREIANVHHVGSHTISHPYLTSIPLEAAHTEIFDSKRSMEDLIGKPVTSFCYPRGYCNQPIKELVQAAGYEDARTTKVGYITEPEDPYETHTAVHVGYPREEYGESHWTLYAQSLFREAQKDDDSVFQFWGHGFELEERDEWDNFEMFLEKITA